MIGDPLLVLALGATCAITGILVYEMLELIHR
jgi:hypothetical protein